MASTGNQWRDCALPQEHCWLLVNLQARIQQFLTTTWLACELTPKVSP